MRFTHLTAAIACAPLLCSVARADDAPKFKHFAPSAPEALELWKNAPLSVTEPQKIERSQLADAATKEFSVVAGLREWRETFDGKGKFARRDLAKGQILGSDAKFTLGRVAPPALAGVGASGAGVTAQWGNFEIGSTLRPREMDMALLEFDRALSGKKGRRADEQSASWLRGHLGRGKENDVEFSIARAARDVAPGEVVKLREGTFASASAKLNLPLSWKLNGAYAHAAIDETDEDKTSWNAKLNGPIAHPLGRANAEIEWRESDAGYATLAENNANGGTQGAARLTQEIKTGWLSGQLKLAATQRERRNLDKAHRGDALENRDATGVADLKLKVTPNLSIKANGALGAAQITRAGDGFAASLHDDNGGVSTFLEETQTQGGDVGVEWNLSKGLSVAATLGTSQTLGWRDENNNSAVWTPFGASEENRVGFELRHKDKAGSLLAKYATRARDDEKLADWQQLETVRLQAERPFLFGTKVSTILDLARGGDASWSDENSVARRVETQLKFSREARLDLKFRDGAALPGGWLSDPLSSPFRASGTPWNTGDREFGARINTGSAAGSNGFGLALEYARQQRSGNDNDQWRVGLTWK